MKRNPITTLCSTAAITAALTASAHATAIAVFDFASNRGTATTQQFIDTGASLIDLADTVTLVDSATLGAATNATPFLLGSGISLAVDTTSGAFTYGNSAWNGNANMPLMGDAWLFNGLGATGKKTITLSGLSTALTSGTSYRIYLYGSYGGNEYTKFGDLTYDGTNYGTKDSVSVSGTGAAITNAADMAVEFDFSTGGTVADTMTFTVGKATGATGNAAGIQGIAIVAVPEPSSSALLALGGLTLILRRRK